MSSAQLGEEEQTTVNEIDPKDADASSSFRSNGAKGTAKGTAKKAQPHASPFYNNLVPAYQALWPAMAKRRILATIKALDIPAGTNLLEVGVGTGMSLESYPKNISVTGVDLSEAMLSEAEQAIQENHWNHINVLPMNAEKLTFPDSTFDMVTSFHTISVVSEPRKMMSEIVRVCKPGARILLINHFRSDNPLIAKVVDQAGNITKRLGWRTDLEVNEVLGELPLRLDERYKTNPFSLFTVMKATCKP
ncbi:putative methyltransferase YcgJ [Rubripirellula obstinata]|uniref:Putative methyltransferase YcgJ n=1 Tax=Rubripirellula obstinata TaxID=406547 RepID=A0A5B1CF05_9BACT|nr:methyltransferase domain-containing protein [Rubripirellula obstinata]KAA1258329.1 putative methyltransferase YcgJ [Rubripirellula obstinata]